MRSCFTNYKRIEDHMIRMLTLKVAAEKAAADKEAELRAVTVGCTGATLFTVKINNQLIRRRTVNA